MTASQPERGNTGAEREIGAGSDEPDAARLLGQPIVQALLLKAATIDRDLDCLTSPYFAQRAQAEVARRQRYGGRLSLLVAVPDQAAQQKGQATDQLRELAAAVRAQLRGTDLLGRWDDELVALLPETDLAGATRLARRIVATPSAKVGGAEGTRATTSIGIATWLGPGETLGTLIERARGGLEEARAQGGNRVAVS